MEVFTDLDFAKNVAIMSETLEILILALKILHEEFSDRNCKLLGPKPRSGPPVTSAVYPQQFPFSAIRLTMWIPLCILVLVLTRVVAMIKTSKEELSRHTHV